MTVDGQREELLESEATPRLRAHDLESISMAQIVPVGIELMFLPNVGSRSVLFRDAAEAYPAFKLCWLHLISVCHPGNKQVETGLSLGVLLAFWGVVLQGTRGRGL
jgi:hypothetical protein